MVTGNNQEKKAELIYATSIVGRVLVTAMVLVAFLLWVWHLST
jgi:hypothetical protein